MATRVGLEGSEEPRRWLPDGAARRELAARHLEIADLYLAAAGGLEIPDHAVASALGDLRTDLADLRERLLRPQLVQR